MNQLRVWLRVKIVFLMIVSILSFVACGSGDNDSQSAEGDTGENETIENSNLNGIWYGTINPDGDAATDVAAFMNDGEIFILGGCIEAGTYTYSQDNFHATVCTSATEAEITGNKSDQEEITATYRYSNSTTTGNIVFELQTDTYNRPSSFNRLSGEWASDEIEQSKYSIDAEGGLTGTFMESCQISGVFSIIDPEHNLYNLDVDLSQCEFEGQYHGLVALYYDDTTLFGGLINDQNLTGFFIDVTRQ